MHKQGTDMTILDIVKAISPPNNQLTERLIAISYISSRKPWCASTMGEIAEKICAKNSTKAQLKNDQRPLLLEEKIVLSSSDTPPPIYQ